MERPEGEAEAPLIDPNKPEVSEALGEAAGGVSGVIAGAAIGALGGPIGSIVGAIAGAIAGWWAGHTIAETAREYDHQYDPLYRERFSRSAPADLAFDDIRPALQLGYLAGANPDWHARSFDDVEPQLRQGWSTVSTHLGPWDRVRDYAHDAFDSARAGRTIVLDEQVIVAASHADLSQPGLADAAIADLDPDAGLTEAERRPDVARRLSDEPPPEANIQRP
jgi:hypothetical protein